MRRRQLLSGLAATAGAATAGCASLRAASEPFTFGVSNWRDRSYTAEVVLRKNGDRILFDARVDVPAHRPADDDPRGILVRDLTAVSDGDVIDARVDVDGREFETAYEITCSHSENAENNLFFRIFSDEDRGMRFDGSEC